MMQLGELKKWESIKRGSRLSDSTFKVCHADLQTLLWIYTHYVSCEQLLLDLWHLKGNYFSSFQVNKRGLFYTQYDWSIPVKPTMPPFFEKEFCNTTTEEIWSKS